MPSSHVELQEVAPPGGLQEAEVSSSDGTPEPDALLALVRGHDAKLAALERRHRTEVVRYRLALALVSAVAPALAFGGQWSHSVPPDEVCRWLGEPPPAASSAPPSTPLGPGPTTTLCQQRVYEEYSSASLDDVNMVRPLTFEPADAESHRVFDDVSFVRLPPGVVGEQWSCVAADGCADADTGAERGFAYLWLPRGAARNATRLLYVHGGSWYYGSPEETSYAPFCATIAQLSGMPVLAIDYPLLPIGDVDTVLQHIGRATRWLATHEPLDVVADPGAASAPAAAASLGDAPRVLILGDSSGGGSATSALLAQASPTGLPQADGATLSGGVVYSPWLNLACDTPTYVSEAFREIREVHVLEASCGLSAHRLGSALHRAGDIAFTQLPAANSASFRANGAANAGPRRSVYDEVANPLYASREVLQRVPPIQIHTAISEVLSAESAIFATKLAAVGGAAELHLYDGMWHDFPMYYGGCDAGHNGSLLFAHVALNRTAAFLQHVGAHGVAPFAQTGAPTTLLHYEYPEGHDSASIIAYHAVD